MEDFSEKLYQALQYELELYGEMGFVPPNKINGALNKIRESIAKLKNYIVHHEFPSEQKEIDFFKLQKPKFFAEYIYITDFFAIQTSRPPYDELTVKNFFEEQLNRVRFFFEHNKFLYQYYQLDGCDLDHLLFLRAAGPVDLFLPEVPDADTSFSTKGDYIFAKFKAYERLQVYLLEELRNIRPATSEKVNPEISNGKSADLSAVGGLKWTGESINLVELGYGIWLTGQVNHGNASVTEIVEELERMFRIKIGKAHRRWQSISARKRVSQVKFIDEIKDAILKRIDDELAR